MTEIARQRLAGDMLLHVSTAGDDSNSGIMPGQAIRTLNEFYRRVRSSYDLAGHSLVAQLADGEYLEDEITCVAATIGAVQVIVQGNETDPNAVTLRCNAGKKLFYSRDLGITTLRNVTLGTTGKGSWLVNVTTFSTIDLDGVSFEAAPEGIHIFVCQGFLVVQNNYRILGGASRHLSASDNGVAYYGGFTVEIPQPVVFDEFAVAEAGALITAGGVPMKFAGDGLAASTGRKFHVSNNGILLSAGAEFPGDKPGIGTETVLEAMMAAERRAVAEKNFLLAQKDRLLERQELLLAERDNTLAEERRSLAERDASVAEQRQLLAEQKRLLAERDEILRLRETQLADREATLRAMRNSRSWRLTAPLRSAMSRLRK